MAAVFSTLGMIRWALEPYREQLKRQNVRMTGISQLDFGQRTPLATGSDYTIAPPQQRLLFIF
jgi:hypothetical protein